MHAHSCLRGGASGQTQYGKRGGGGGGGGVGGGCNPADFLHFRY